MIKKQMILKNAIYLGTDIRFKARKLYYWIVQKTHGQVVKSVSVFLAVVSSVLGSGSADRSVSVEELNK